MKAGTEYRCDIQPQHYSI